MRILVTGGSGFVGSSVIRRLSGSHTVVGLSRRPTPGAHESIQHDLSVPGIAAILASVAPCEVVIHAAARIDMTPFNAEVVATNTVGALNVAALAAEWNAYVIYLSSIQVIGRPQETPIIEDHPTHPLTTYHATKLFGEHMMAASVPESCSLRLTAPVGTGMPSTRILPTFVRRAATGEGLKLAGGGGRRQDYVRADDIAEAVAACIERRPRGVYNLGAGLSLSNLELARLCIETLGSWSEITFSDRPDPEEDARWEVSIEKARDTFGYSPHSDLREVIRALAEQA